MILSRNQLTFDKNASEIIGVDNTGNTVYDSVFTVKAPYFENKGFDIMSGKRDCNHADSFQRGNQ